MKEKEDFLFTDDNIEFIEENEDRKLNIDIIEAIVKVAKGENGKGNTRKTIIAIASAAAVILKTCADKATSDKPLTALDYSQLFSEILRYFCLMLDHITDEADAEE